MYEDKFKILESIKNISEYCKANCNHGECKACIFYSPRRSNCPFLDGIVPYNWAALNYKVFKAMEV